MENSERIGEYELVKPLGSGSFGTIQEALWRGRRVALKIVTLLRIRKEPTI